MALESAEKHPLSDWKRILERKNAGILPNQAIVLRETVLAGMKVGLFGQLTERSVKLALTELFHPDFIEYGEFKYFPKSREVKTPLKTKLMHLTSTEARIFYPIFVGAPEMVTGEEINEILGRNLDREYDNYINVYISRIRHKIGDEETEDIIDGRKVKSFHIIKTIPRLGFKFSPDPDYLENLAK